jgi:hypothetical protein
MQDFLHVWAVIQGTGGMGGTGLGMVDSLIGVGSSVYQKWENRGFLVHWTTQNGFGVSLVGGHHTKYLGTKYMGTYLGTQVLWI